MADLCFIVKSENVHTKSVFSEIHVHPNLQGKSGFSLNTAISKQIRVDYIEK